MNKERLWSKDFIIVSMTNFLIYLVFFLLMVIMASYAVDKYRASPGIGGLVSGIFIIGILKKVLIAEHQNFFQNSLSMARKYTALGFDANGNLGIMHG